MNYTIPLENDDMADVQKVSLDTLHKKGNPRKVITKEADWLFESIESCVEGKGASATGIITALRGLNKIDFCIFHDVTQGSVSFQVQ